MAGSSRRPVVEPKDLMDGDRKMLKRAHARTHARTHTHTIIYSYISKIQIPVDEIVKMKEYEILKKLP